ncbi:MAG: transposase family protein [Thermovirga sp.]|jgi:hypothetical protein|nr:transposase family protein [Thermovirga sp.]
MASDNTNRRSTRNRKLTEEEKERNRMLSRTRVRVEHVFGVVKNIFGYRKVRYKGLAKNTNGIHVFLLCRTFTWSGGNCSSSRQGRSVPGYRGKGQRGGKRGYTALRRP